MNFIYKLRHKKSGLYLSPTHSLSENGIIWSEFPDFSCENIEVDGKKTSIDDWEFVQFAIIIHEVHQPIQNAKITYVNNTFGSDAWETIKKAKLAVESWPQWKRDACKHLMTGHEPKDE